MCDNSQIAWRSWEIISNVIFIFLAWHMIHKKQYFFGAVSIGMFLASTMFHICDPEDRWGCNDYCNSRWPSLYFGDESIATMFITLAPLYYLPPSQEWVAYVAALGQVYLNGYTFTNYNITLGEFNNSVSDPQSTSLAWLVSLTFLITALYRVFIQPDYVLRAWYKYKWPNIYATVTVLVAAGTITIHVYQFTWSYGISHSWLHIGSAVAMYFDCLYTECWSEISHKLAEDKVAEAKAMPEKSVLLDVA